MTSLLQSIDQLTKAHKKTVYTDEGTEIHDRPALLDQLRDAVFGGMERTGGSSTKAKLPISEAAHDLYTLIDTQITEAWAAHTGQVPGVDRPELLANQWAAGVRADAIVIVTTPEQIDVWDDEKGRLVPRVIRIRHEYLPDTLAARWVDLIEDFFNPERTAGIKAPCLQCGASKVPRRRDGETTMSDAMVFRRDRDTGRTIDARCLNCGAVWPPSQFEFLAKAIGLTVPMTSDTASFHDDIDTRNVI